MGKPSASSVALAALFLGGLAIPPGRAQVAAPATGELRWLNPQGAFTFLKRPLHQAELKLTDEQKQKVADRSPEVTAIARDVLAKLRAATPQEREAQADALWARVREAGDKVVVAVLSPEQQRQLKQIQYRQEGLQVFTYLEVRNALKLTDDQRAKVRAVVSDYEKEFHALHKGNPPPSKLEVLRKQYEGKVMGLLTDEQRGAWKALAGEPTGAGQG